LAVAAAAAADDHVGVITVDQAATVVVAPGTVRNTGASVEELT
jgi:hypothetical protein